MKSHLPTIQSYPILDLVVKYTVIYTNTEYIQIPITNDFPYFSINDNLVNLVV